MTKADRESGCSQAATCAEACAGRSQAERRATVREKKAQKFQPRAPFACGQKALSDTLKADAGRRRRRSARGLTNGQ